jgi:hypothetical protein
MAFPCRTKSTFRGNLMSGGSRTLFSWGKKDLSKDSSHDEPSKNKKKDNFFDTAQTKEVSLLNNLFTFSEIHAMDHAWYGHYKGAFRTDFSLTRICYHNVRPGKKVAVQLAGESEVGGGGPRPGTLDTAAIQAASPFELAESSKRFRSLFQYLLSTQRAWIRPLTFTFPCKPCHTAPSLLSKKVQKLKFDTPISLHTVGAMAVDLLARPMTLEDLDRHQRFLKERALKFSQDSSTSEDSRPAYRSPSPLTWHMSHPAASHIYAALPSRPKKAKKNAIPIMKLE